MSPSSAPTQVALALNRFGLGARPDEPLPADPKAWLLGQFERHSARPAAWADTPASSSLLVAYGEQLRAVRQADAGNAQARRAEFAAQTQARYRSAVDARVTSSLETPSPFGERLVHFWANHFAVSIDKMPLAALAGSFELEAIRPQVFGRFDDMLLAVERHPAMLLYLDQARSVGPASPLGRRDAVRRPDTARGLNENLAREILELHTLGVNGGYSQGDVQELARALTGWSLGALPGVPPMPQGGVTPGGFGFNPLLHEPGARQLLGRRYEAAGQAQGEAILRDLASAPATARHLAFKLARHFVADTPPPALVDRLTESWLRSRGDLPSVYRALIDAPEAWAPPSPKFKTPWEWVVSTLRGLGRHEPGRQPVAPLLTQLGQPVWRPGSPAGFDDVAESWVAPDSLLRRVDAAQRIAERAGGSVDARALGPRLLPGGLSDDTTHAIARAESASTALALLLVSPEFLRR
ncbi:DUF1800 domain-containing protein [Sphaerotilaceae bacterium SBD11-9]